jgi:REP element-mobilizing transposase RayT
MDIKDKGSRKSVRLKEFDYSWSGYYFVTMVSYKRKNCFGKITDDVPHLNRVGKIVEDCWNEIPSHFPYLETDVYAVMPNHFHGIIIIQDVVCASHVGAQHAAPLPENKNVKPQPLWVIVRSFKSAVTKRVHDLGLLSQEKIWQRGYYEHIIRDEQDYQKIYEYIEANPINWSLDEENKTGTHGRDV